MVQAKHPVSYVESDWREDTSDHSSGVTHPPFSRVDRIPEWDPPDAEVWQGPYYTVPLHNSKYVLKVTVHFQGTNPPPPAETCEVSIYLQNLQIDDLETPPYFIWKPSVMPGVPFAAVLHHAQEGSGVLTMDIFSADNNETPVFTNFYNIEYPGFWFDTWYGQLTGGSIAEAGIYTWGLYGVAGSGCNWDDDCNRSSGIWSSVPEWSRLKLCYSVRNGNPVKEAEYVGVSGSDAGFRIYYRLLSDRPASEGKIIVFGPDLGDPIATRALGGDDLNPADHIVNVYVPLSRLSRIGKYLFLICVKDNHVDRDRSHRRLWALPLALSFEYKQVKLTDPPLVEQEPMLFRGKPQPCPVLVKGEVLPGEQWASPIIGLTVEKGYLDADNKWHPVEAERQVPDSELEDWNIWWDDQALAWRFRVVWKQQLSRTKFSPNQERYRLRAYALCNRSESATTADFRVMSMAKPVNANISSDYTETDRPAGDIRVVAYADEYSSGTMAVPIDVDPGWGGPHLGIDYGASAGMTVNSAEVGVLEDKPLPIPQDDKLGIVTDADRGTLSTIYYTAQEYLSMGYRVRVRCLPTTASRVVFKESYLGPHRLVKHGMVNISLRDQDGNAPDEQYERDEGPAHTVTVLLASVTCPKLVRMWISLAPLRR